MNPHSDPRIDHVLHALRDVESPSGLEARIAARLTQASESRRASASRSATKSLFAVILTQSLPKGKDPRILIAGAPLYTLAATSLVLLAALSLFALHSYHPGPTSIIRSQSSPQNSEAGAARNPDLSVAQKSNPGIPFERAALQSRHHVNSANTALATEASSIRPQPTNFEPSAPPPDPAPPTDPDTIALAETRAPSHPAPPMPLTQQELLTLAVLRSGDKEEIAALNPVHREALFAQEQAAFHDFFASPTPHPRNNDRR